MPPADTLQHAQNVFRRHHGVLRMAEALRAGVHRRTLYAMRDAGQIESLARGLYRLADASPPAHPDLTTVAARIPQGVICLVSALAFHELTTQIPHEIWVALPRDSRPPRLQHPPIRVFRMSAAAFGAGIEKHTLDGIATQVYSREKTLADCFKYRNQVGLDVVLEALRLYKQQGSPDVEAILRYAAICRVSRVARPYLESIL